MAWLSNGFTVTSVLCCCLPHYVLANFFQQYFSGIFIFYSNNLAVNCISNFTLRNILNNMHPPVDPGNFMHILISFSQNLPERTERCRVCRCGFHLPAPSRSLPNGI